MNIIRAGLLPSFMRDIYNTCNEFVRNFVIVNVKCENLLFGKRGWGNQKILMQKNIDFICKDFYVAVSDRICHSIEIVWLDLRRSPQLFDLLQPMFRVRVTFREFFYLRFVNIFQSVLFCLFIKIQSFVYW